MTNPYTIIFNAEGKAAVIIDNRVASNESKMIQRFIDDGYTVKDVSEDEYTVIHKKGNFNPF
ncbi:hypothetical protein ABD91_00710 [Lysinibacillus sphaericus]|uniref:hypothetical protein n=1 Tax=Lysinibacillus sphaericus TaxID=1421 RepID=UPI0018CF7A23|nr:hypothetical protein [Lysinibacillus sphaericus]MBG9689448.1 hypothetical protein [Lysinibacillus sphaericus]